MYDNIKQLLQITFIEFFNTKHNKLITLSFLRIKIFNSNILIECIQYSILQILPLNGQLKN